MQQGDAQRVALETVRSFARGRADLYRQKAAGGAEPVAGPGYEEQAAAYDGIADRLAALDAPQEQTPLEGFVLGTLHAARAMGAEEVEAAAHRVTERLRSYYLAAPQEPDLSGAAALASEIMEAFNIPPVKGWRVRMESIIRRAVTAGAWSLPAPAPAVPADAAPSAPCPECTEEVEPVPVQALRCPACGDVRGVRVAGAVRELVEALAQQRCEEWDETGAPDTEDCGACVPCRASAALTARPGAPKLTGWAIANLERPGTEDVLFTQHEGYAREVAGRVGGQVVRATIALAAHRSEGEADDDARRVHADPDPRYWIDMRHWHNGYDPEMREALPELREPASAEEALRELVQEAPALAAQVDTRETLRRLADFEEAILLERAADEKSLPIAAKRVRWLAAEIRRLAGVIAHSARREHARGPTPTEGEGDPDV